MKMNPEEITAIIKDQIKNYDVDLNVDDVGSVIEIGDGVIEVLSTAGNNRLGGDDFDQKITDYMLSGPEP